MIIGKPNKHTKDPTLTFMITDYALITEGELRAFYLVLPDHNAMLEVIEYVFRQAKMKLTQDTLPDNVKEDLEKKF